MADFIRAQITARNSLEPFADAVTNTLYFMESSEVDITDPDWNNLGDDLRALAASWPCYAGCDELTVKLYSMEDPEPRRPRYDETQSIVRTAPGPREVALCLSFTTEANARRHRGRIYLGPFTPARMGDRPPNELLTAVEAVADQIKNLGGDNVKWCTFSPTEFAQTEQLGASFAPVHHAWVDNAWDTVRSRGQKPDARRVIAIGE